MPACISADGGHLAHMMWTGWSRLIWHNFVKVVDNWIKLCILAYVGTPNRRVKFGWKISNRFGKIATSPQQDFLTRAVEYFYINLILNTEYLYTNAYRLGLHGWSRLVKMAAFVAQGIEKRIMLFGFQISHSNGLNGSSHKHHIFYVH